MTNNKKKLLFCFSCEMSVTLDSLPEELYEHIQEHLIHKQGVANLAASSKTIYIKSKSSPKIRLPMTQFMIFELAAKFATPCLCIRCS
jgi:hypothetical protein